MASMFDKLKELAEQHKELEAKLADPDLIKNQTAYQKILKEIGSISKLVEAYKEHEATLQKIKGLDEIIGSEEEEEMKNLARKELEEFKILEKEKVELLKRLLVRDDTHVGKNLIFEVRAGTGGDEASLFAADLFRMYQRFAENTGLKTEVLDTSHSEVGGFKEITFSISGKKAWESLRFESGGHRVQRVPVTESQGRIHTSAATVAVLLEAESVDIDINDADLKIDTYRAGGPGGQNVNKVASAIRITHEPTGVVVQCQDESSQHKNKSKAMRILSARLYDLELSRVKDERAETRRDQIGSGDRNMRIRTYNFPQNRVTDHRSKTYYSLEIIMAGRLEKIIDDLSEWDVEEKLKSFQGV